MAEYAFSVVTNYVFWWKNSGSNQWCLLNKTIFVYRLCWEKFGWSSQKADELLLPVLNEYNKHEVGARLLSFFCSLTHIDSCFMFICFC